MQGVFQNFVRPVQSYYMLYGRAGMSALPADAGNIYNRSTKKAAFAAFSGKLSA